MDESQSLEENLQISIKSRDYKCPCGKSYLSYAALFTHVKQKHEGKAPGKIIKPPSMHPKRGRPPLKIKAQQPVNQAQMLHEAEEASNQPQFPTETAEQQLAREALAEQAVSQSVRILGDMPVEDINKSRLNQIQAFSEMIVYLNTRTQARKLVHGNVCIGDGLQEYLQLVCNSSYRQRFNLLYMLYMLFLQFVIDSQNNKAVISECNLDLFCEYLNDFVQRNLREMSEYYQIKDIWIVKPENTVKILTPFFQWLMQKRYVTYLISARQQTVQKVEATQPKFISEGTSQTFSKE